jgi:hypothetical protein
MLEIYMSVLPMANTCMMQWELVDGPDLLDLLNEMGGCMSEEAAAFYWVQLLEAVLFMHAKGFCHRDIKPEVRKEGRGRMDVCTYIHTTGG